MLVDGVLGVDARGWDALPWTMSDSYLCSAHDARVCVWIGCSTMGPCATPTCEAHRVLVDARDGVLSRVPMSDPHLCSAQGARVCSWMGCSNMGP